jgi:geranylgeranyl diphosphate synthase type I
MKEKTGAGKKVQKYLSNYIQDSDPYFEEFFSRQKAFTDSISPIASQMVEKFQDFIGGKRLRGALTRSGYQMFGGGNDYEITKASLAVEIIHGLALIHDDIMDQDDLRRGKPTIHKQYETSYREGGSDEKAQTYGKSMAILVGDLGAFLTNIIIAETNFPEERKVRLMKRISEVILLTIYGQGLDVTYEQKLRPLEEEALRVHQYKTSYYTVTGPLEYGAILAGCNESDPRYQALEKYGLPIGLAFQLKDDEMGIFSEEEQIGKPVFSDLREGKVTLLFAKTFEKADNSQLKFLKSVYGKPKADRKDLEKVREIITETGALEYSRKICLDLIAEGKSHISEITRDESYRELLKLIAEFVTKRDK